MPSYTPGKLDKTTSTLHLFLIDFRFDLKLHYQMDIEDLNETVYGHMTRYPAGRGCLDVYPERYWQTEA